ncbi:MAG: hypothetical protein EAX96_09945 [Candidatus Lokiarchaeota archaeon]|nr:hypothetical protein [Candidatus Lokiarchaeota archaeon]
MSEGLIEKKYLHEIIETLSLGEIYRFPVLVKKIAFYGEGNVIKEDIQPIFLFMVRSSTHMSLLIIKGCKE